MGAEILGAEAPKKHQGEDPRLSRETASRRAPGPHFRSFSRILLEIRSSSFLLLQSLHRFAEPAAIRLNQGGGGESPQASSIDTRRPLASVSDVGSASVRFCQTSAICLPYPPRLFRIPVLGPPKHHPGAPKTLPETPSALIRTLTSENCVSGSILASFRSPRLAS